MLCHNFDDVYNYYSCRNTICQRKNKNDNTIGNISTTTTLNTEMQHDVR